MENKDNKQKLSSRTLLVWVIVAVLLVVGGTYAWFTFNNITNIEPNTAGTIVNEDGGNLFIANNYDGPYAETCDLVMMSHGGDLDPLSTSNLNSFFRAGAQNPEGITILYSEATDVDDCTMHGKVYLKSGTAQNVYLFKPKMTFGDDIQALASMRLGMKITDESGTHTYIFRLDDMADLSSAESKQTTKQANVVVESITSGAPNYVSDMALNINDYTATQRIGAPVVAGANRICRIEVDKIVTIEYWLYLEGCDKNCFNAVQKKNVAFAMAFAGA